MTPQDLRERRTKAKAQARRERNEWHDIEHAAHEQVQAELRAAEANPPTLGALIAWTECSGWQTDKLSPLHRAGSTVGGETVTLCGDKVPAAVRRLPLGPGLIQTLDRCRWCEEAYARKGVYAA